MPPLCQGFRLFRRGSLLRILLLRRGICLFVGNLTPWPGIVTFCRKFHPFAGDFDFSPGILTFRRRLHPLVGNFMPLRILLFWPGIRLFVENSTPSPGILPLRRGFYRFAGGFYPYSRKIRHLSRILPPLPVFYPFAKRSPFRRRFSICAKEFTGIS